MNPKLNILYALNLELNDEQTRRILLAKKTQEDFYKSMDDVPIEYVGEAITKQSMTKLVLRLLKKAK